MNTNKNAQMFAHLGVDTSKQSNYTRHSPLIKPALQHRVGSFFAIRNRVRVTVLKGVRA